MSSEIVAQLCPHCKEGRLEEDNMGTEVTKVCKECGFTSNHVVLRGPTMYDEGFSASAPSSALEDKYKTRLDLARPRVQQKILDSMKKYLERYPNNEQLYEKASQLFMEVVSGEYKYSRARNKSALAAACMVTSLRDAGNAVLLAKLCKEIGVETKKTMKALKLMKEKGHADTVHVADDGLVNIFLENYPEFRDRKDVKTRLLKICELLSDLQFAGSRELKIIVAFYFAIISEEPIKTPAMLIGTFCENYTIIRNIALSKQLSQARNKIFLLAKRLPWVSPEMKLSNCHTELHNILKMKHSLIKHDWNDGCSVAKHRRKTLYAHDGTPITDQMTLEMPEASITALRRTPPLPEGPDPDFVSTSETIGEDDMDENELNECLRSKEELEVASKLRKIVQG